MTDYPKARALAEGAKRISGVAIKRLTIDKQDALARIALAALDRIENKLNPGWQQEAEERLAALEKELE